MIDRLILPCRACWTDLPLGSHSNDFDLGRFDRPLGATKMDVLVLTYESIGQIKGAVCATYKAPVMLRSDYADLQAEAQRQRGRIKVLPKGRTKKKK
ncbi:hypothetical protein DM806_10000 [Sphingobium lactosutens]|nr:hypothetical protein [Sphingobium lactosutens]